MTSSSLARVESNPFATRFVSPGQLPWLATDNLTVALLVDRFNCELKRQGAIVGAHGSGKSTLLESLVPLLGCVVWRQSATMAVPDVSVPPMSAPNMSAEANGLVWLGLRRSIGSWQRLRSSLPHWRCAQLVIIDGYEQLNRAERWLVRMMVKRRNMGLLVTHHGGMQPIPTLVELQPSIDVLEQLVNHLLDRVSPEVPWRGFCTNRHLLKRLLAEEQGSVREVFMRLYDLIEDEREQLRR